MSEAYRRKRTFYQDVSATTTIAAADSATVHIIPAKTNYTVFVQKIYVTILTDAAQTLTFQDTAGSPVVVEATDSSPGANTQYIWDFGPAGYGLTQDKGLDIAISGAGLAAHVEVEAYSKLTAITAA